MPNTDPTYRRNLLLAAAALAAAGCPAAEPPPAAKPAAMPDAPPPRVLAELTAPVAPAADAAPAAAVRPVASLSPLSLWDEYGRNSLAADAKYKGRYVELTGTPLGVKTDAAGRHFVAYPVLAYAGMTLAALGRLPPREQEWYRNGPPPGVVAFVGPDGAAGFAGMPHGREVRVVARVAGRFSADAFRDYVVRLEDARLAGVSPDPSLKSDKRPERPTPPLTPQPVPSPPPPAPVVNKGPTPEEVAAASATEARRQAEAKAAAEKAKAEAERTRAEREKAAEEARRKAEAEQAAADEKAARQKLDLALTIFKASRKRGVERLEEILAKYPKTKAAKEAREALERR